jgi:hypothetical protein
LFNQKHLFSTCITQLDTSCNAQLSVVTLAGLFFANPPPPLHSSPV